MSALFQFFLFLLTLNNLALLGMGRLRTLINLVTAQGILLGGLLLMHDHALLAAAVLLIKGGLLPWLLRVAGVVLLIKALLDKPTRWENFMPAVVAFALSLLIGWIF